MLASRQPGSAFKPFVYAAALERGDSPATRVPGVLSPSFEEERERVAARVGKDDPAAFVTYREALARSDNDAALAVQQKVGTAAVADLARRAGLPAQPLVPSLALGTGSATPLELTVAFAPFANAGFAVRPRSLAAVIDQRGRTVFQEKVQRVPVLSAAAAWQTLSMLREVVDSGTGTGARAAGVPAGGKTGTTDDYHDAWFVGFVPGLAAGVWVGFDRPATIGEEAYAARIAVPIWADFVRRAAKLRPPGTFIRPRASTPSNSAASRTPSRRTAARPTRSTSRTATSCPRRAARCTSARCASGSAARSAGSWTASAGCFARQCLSRAPPGRSRASTRPPRPRAGRAPARRGSPAAARPCAGR